jgi:hypothetical protein
VSAASGVFTLKVQLRTLGLEGARCRHGPICHPPLRPSGQEDQRTAGLGVTGLRMTPWEQASGRRPPHKQEPLFQQQEAKNAVLAKPRCVPYCPSGHPCLHLLLGGMALVTTAIPAGFPGMTRPRRLQMRSLRLGEAAPSATLSRLQVR